MPCCLNYRNAEKLGKSGLLCTLLFCFATPCLPIFLLRHEARDKYDIEVSIEYIHMYVRFGDNFVNLKNHFFREVFAVMLLLPLVVDVVLWFKQPLKSRIDQANSY